MSSHRIHIQYLMVDVDTTKKKKNSKFISNYNKDMIDKIFLIYLG